MGPEGVSAESSPRTTASAAHPLLTGASLPAAPNRNPAQRGSRLIEVTTARGCSEQVVVALARELMPVFLDGFMHGPNLETGRRAGFFESMQHRLTAADRLVIVRDETGPCALICAGVLDAPPGRIYHLQGIVVVEALQGQGLGRELLERELRETDARFLALHTQSEHMARLAHRVADVSTESLAIVAPWVDHRDLVGRVDRGRYAPYSLYGDVERFRPHAITGINAPQGDALFIAGAVRPEVQQRSGMPG